MIGRTLSHFKITAKLGEGGMGEVYLAHDTQLERKVALKVLPAELAEDAERLKRLQREARSLAALDHPHIVPVYSLESAEGVHFLTMAYIEGEALEQLIPEEGFSVERLLDLAVPLADALWAAHRQGIIHRDLKPANVMLDLDGRLRVLDFGLAKRDLPAGGDLSQLSTRGLTAQMTREGTILGTYPYMSPEQAEGRVVDPRSDLFSFGVMLYEMACGRRPFEGETGISLITSILRDTQRPIAEVKSGLPARLGEILDKCLDKDRDERYPTAEVLRDELEDLRHDVARGTAVTATARAPQAGLAPGVLWGSKVVRRWTLPAAIVLLALVTLWLWQRQRPPPVTGSPTAASAPAISSLAVLPLKNLSGDPEQDYFVDGMTEALITDLSKISALTVISRSSSMRYKGTDKPLSEIAEELGVDAIIEGSVLREGDRVGITAQLIEVSTDRNIWADRFDREIISILALQGEIAQSIAEGIQVTLTPEEESLLAGARQVDLAAHEAYLKGMFYLQRFTPQDFATASQYFDAAVEIDPDYALPYVGRASVWSFSNQFGLLPPREANPKVMEPLLKALELDDSLPEAHFMLAAWKTWYEYDWPAAEEAFLRALELNPNYADAHVFYSHFLSLLGRGQEGSAEMARALELDPLNPFYQGLHAVQLGMVGRVDEAVEQLEETLAKAPGIGFARALLPGFLRVQGRYEEALIQAKMVARESGDSELEAALERGESEGGYSRALSSAADLLAQRAQATYVPALSISGLYDDAGETEKALVWLERAWDSRDPNLPYIGAPPHFRMYGDPRFQEMLRRMNLPTD